MKLGELPESFGFDSETELQRKLQRDVTASGHHSLVSLVLPRTSKYVHRTSSCRKVEKNEHPVLHGQLAFMHILALCTSDCILC
jgi:hypothetical protein